MNVENNDYKKIFKNHLNSFIENLEKDFRDMYVVFDKMITEEIFRLNSSGFDFHKRKKDKVFKIKKFIIVNNTVIAQLNTGNFVYRISFETIMNEGSFFNDKESALLAYECQDY